MLDQNMEQNEQKNELERQPDSENVQDQRPMNENNDPANGAAYQPPAVVKADQGAKDQGLRDGEDQAPQDGDMNTVRDMIKELGQLIAANQTPKEPTEEEKKAAELAAKKARKQKIRRRRRKALRSLLLRIVVLVVVLYVLLFHLVGITVMPNGDMYPRIDSGDLVLFYRLDKDVRAQDIIVFEKDLVALQAMMDERTESDTVRDDVFVPDSVHEAPAAAEEKDESLGGKIKDLWNRAVEFLKLRRDESKQVFICRVVATAGDTVEITEEGRLIVNGNAMIETNIFSQTTSYVSFTQYPLTLHAGECFVMADQRNGGADSRFFGPVEVDEILGTVITIMRRNNL